MSLKTFHLFFIILAAFFCGAFGIWAVFFTSAADGLNGKLFGTLSLIASVSLFIYSFYFYKKAKNIII